MLAEEKNPMRLALLAVAFAFLANAAAAQECAAMPPSRTSQFFWDYLEACGCEKAAPISTASPDYARFQKVCSRWRERHPQPVVVVVTPAVSSPAPVASPPTVVVTPPRATPECSSVPARVSDTFWSYIDACGCDRLSPVPEASPDHARFLKACSAWRARNPTPVVVVVAPSPQPR
jgi:hypothetical protein